MKATRESTYTVTLNAEEAGKLSRALNRALTATEHMTPARRGQLVNTGTIDQLLALRMVLVSAGAEDDEPGDRHRAGGPAVSPDDGPVA